VNWSIRGLRERPIALSSRHGREYTCAVYTLLEFARFGSSLLE
jgi:hypothetical protein